MNQRYIRSLDIGTNSERSENTNILKNRVNEEMEKIYIQDDVGFNKRQLMTAQLQVKLSKITEWIKCQSLYLET